MSVFQNVFRCMPSKIETFASCEGSVTRFANPFFPRRQIHVLGVGGDDVVWEEMMVWVSFGVYYRARRVGDEGVLRSFAVAEADADPGLRMSWCENDA